MTNDDGGPAFPRGDVPNQSWAQKGMSLRDWFAGQALAGFIAGRSDKSGPGIDASYAEAAVSAGLYADAMIAERSRTDADA